MTSMPSGSRGGFEQAEKLWAAEQGRQQQLMLQCCRGQDWK